MTLYKKVWIDINHKNSSCIEAMSTIHPPTLGLSSLDEQLYCGFGLWTRTEALQYQQLIHEDHFA